MTAQTQSGKFYQKLQKKFSRRINLDLSRIKSALQKIPLDPNIDISGKIVNILGEDGKYTVVQILKSILKQNKQKVSTFTSPSVTHPLDRIFLKNKFISLNKFKKYAEEIIRSRVKLTLFECLTLIYLKSIQNLKNLQFHLIESGCGMERDSTNLFERPHAQIIVNLNLQHQDLTGARNIYDVCKINCGSLSHYTTIYIGKQEPKTIRIVKKILRKNPSKQVFYGKDFKIKKKGNFYLYSDQKGILKLKAKQIYSGGLMENISLAIKVARDLNINNKIIIKALPKIRLLGRLQFIKKGKLRKFLYSKEDLLLDGCHSETAIKNHIKFLKNINKPKYAIWSLMKNRYPEKYVKHLKCFKKIIAITVPGEPNACSAFLLKKIANKHNIQCITAPNIISAIKALSSDRTKVISVIGSLYTVGKVLNLGN